MLLRTCKRVTRFVIASTPRWWTLDEPFVDLGGDESNTILVAGSGRSGTTWVGDVIADMTESRTIFEPFLLNRAGQFLCPRRRLVEEELRRNYQLYLPRSLREQCEYWRPIQEILRGYARSSWPNMRTGMLAFGSRLIKEVRANLFLGYLAETWPRLRIVWIVRNALSVINSQIAMAKRDWSFDWDSQEVLSQKALMEEWLEPFRPSLVSATTLAERLAQRWCIETYVPLRQELQKLPNVHMVRYETLVADPNAWRELSRFVAGESWSGRRFEQYLRKPSATSRSPKATSPAKRDKHEHVSGTDREAITRIVDSYGLSEFCGVA